MNDLPRQENPAWSQTARQLAVYLAARFVVCFLQTIPLSFCTPVAGFLGWLACDVFRIRKRITDDNLLHVFPGETQERRDEIARAMWRHLFLMLCEIAQAPRKIHETNWRDYISIPDKKLMTGHFLAWRPVVLVSGHFGNFELGLFATGILGIPTFAIARPLDNPFLHRWLRRYRECRGQFILPTTGSAAEVQRVLDGGGMLSLLADQHAGSKGCWIDFMGRPASCHKAVALFTLSQDAPMIVSYSIRRGGPLMLEIGCNGVADPAQLDPELADVRALTQWYNQRLEELVRNDPEQYWWVHRRWKERSQRVPAKRNAANVVDRDARAA